MKQTFVFAGLLLSALLLFSTCKKNPVAPKPAVGPDTTSHNFTFTQYTFGGSGGSSFFKDVAIVSDTDIWAVGGIYTDSATYNAAHWDGKAWRLAKIPFIGPCSAVLYPNLQAVWVFGNNNIFVTNGGSIVHFDGTNAVMDCRMNPLLAGAINRIFATSPQNIYLVGNSGAIVYYNGSSWTQMQSGTTIDLQDVWGATNSTTGEDEILAVGTLGSPRSHIIVSIHGTTIDSLMTYPVARIQAFWGLWLIPGQHYYVVGDGIYEKNSLSDSTWKNGPVDITKNATTAVRGNVLNDVFVVGAFGEFLHWNGSTWKSFIDRVGLSNGSYVRVAAKGSLAVAVGENLGAGELDSKAVITIGKR